MSSSPLSKVFCAVLIHLVFLGSVFDIYFKSPVINVDVSFAPSYVAPARRIVIFVADGLRADTFFPLDNDSNNNASLAPYLRDIMEKHGTWGVSHTRVPTESRPGHVALLAGMHEDPSAITRGWKENPVDFDTVFNQSGVRTWAWGSPDILPMFAKGVTPAGRMTTKSYAPEEEDFFGNNELHKLDQWVFDKVERFLELGSGDGLKEDKVIFFLHLLGCDSNGHANRPHSVEYKDNVKMVDEGVRKVVDLVDNYFRHDDRTAFIFTSDHGMTDWGSHGTGMEHETQVPIVAWGAGVSHPRKPEGTNIRSKPNWKVDHLERLDVQQADVAPLISTLIGAGIPKHSVGKLPHAYLKMPAAEKVEAALAVANQTNAMFRSIQNTFASYFHLPFPDLDEEVYHSGVKRVRRQLQMGREEKALESAEELFELSLRGVDYYRSYYRVHLLLATSFGYVGFILLTSTTIIKNYAPVAMRTETSKRTRLLTDLFSVFSLLLVTLVFTLQNVPWHYLIYYLTPVAVGHILLRDLLVLIQATVLPQGLNASWLISRLAFVLLILECSIFAFFDRRLLTPCILLLTGCQLHYHKSSPGQTRLVFFLSNLALCAFSFQPSVGKERSNVLVFAGAIVSVLASQVLAKDFEKKPPGTLLLLTIFPILSAFCVWLSSGFEFGAVISTCIMGASWTVFLSGVPLAMLTTAPLALPRLLSITVALQSSYLLLSLTYEGLFLCCLVVTLFAWLFMESDERHKPLLEVMQNDRERNVVSERDVFRALLFLCYSLVSFFGTGNIASLNSFDPQSIRCLVSVFNPFLMGGILLAKVLIPFLVVACFTFVVSRVTRMPKSLLFLLVLLFSDVMGLHFFFLVTDEGSWQQIGTSLSHFVIAEATVIFLQILFLLAGGIMTYSRTKVLDRGGNN